MFSGVIRTMSKVVQIIPRDTGLVISVAKPKAWRPAPGDSISINGVCSTVVSNKKNLVFEYMPETLRVSNLGTLRTGEAVHIEQSLRMKDFLDGHLVYGHVDTVGMVTRIEREGSARVVTVSLAKKDAHYMRLVVPKGSVALDGVSLTVVDARKNDFSVKLLPYTLEHTNLQSKAVGSTLNIEFDVLAKYVQRLVSKNHANKK